MIEEDIDLFVKHALSNENTRDMVRNYVERAANSTPNDMLKNLIEMRSVLFPEGGALVEPEEMDPEFMDFIADDNMWERIYEMADKGISKEDIFGVKLIQDSLKDFLDRGVIFSSNVEPIDTEIKFEED
jgi:hypothetical protein